MGIVSMLYIILLATVIDFKTQRYAAVLLLPAIASFTVILSLLYQRGYKYLVIALVSVFMLNNLAGNAYLILRDKKSNFSRAMRELRASIPVQSRVIGHPTLWFGLKENDYVWVSGLTLNYMNDFKPDYFALINPSSPYLKERTIVKTKDVYTPETTLESYKRAVDFALTHDGRLIRVIEAGDYGPIEVYEVGK